MLVPLGHGAFGIAYKAHDTELDRIAIKIPRLSNVDSSPEALEFLREARAVASIISIHEIGLQDGIPYPVCNLVDGVTLADILTARGYFPETAKLIAEVADALHYLNDKIPRDITLKAMAKESGKRYVLIDSRNATGKRMLRSRWPLLT